ncbi:hypothetical protein OPU71_13185 [Niveibacterium sp. 24ML]|uniref:hypothetical protein n=1 Tax=Niveibacterium sp. 24ML TaxID=2985512 RepID=UPI00226D78EF|nr:hypothetical protein [Niveibacterium sp. 24ML]MCX9157080.1 hypothetical protein [Niveibacterium sp. 24ML]
MDASDPRSDHSPFQTPALIAALLAALIAALNLGQTPVPDSGRPPPNPQAPQLELRANARLWEDPFIALHQDSRAKPGLAGPAQSEPANPDSKAVRPCKGFTTAIREGSALKLFVIANDGSASEDAELRIRARAAVLAALNRWGYEPSDSEHLRGPCHFAQGAANVAFRAMSERFLLSREKDSQTGRNQRGELGPTYAGRANVVDVFWISDGPMRLANDNEQVAAQYRELLKAFRSEMALEPDQTRRPGYTIIGPLDREITDRLERGLRCLRRPASSANDNTQHATGLPPCDATDAPQEGSVVPLILRPFRSVATLEASLPGLEPGHRVEEFGPSDDMLANALVTELERRGLNLTRPTTRVRVIAPEQSAETNRYACLFDHHVALISEWDTHFARDFRRAFVGRIRAGASELHAELRATDTANVHGFAFTRGLDGKSLQSRPSDYATTPATSVTASATSGSPPPDAAYERSMQQSQRDYVRRLGDQIALRDARLKAACGRGAIGIRAIGILASDFYDKRMLMQSLHGRFPRMQFFTTGFDARMLDHENSVIMRNLLVASRFDTALAPPIQRFIIPFRDGSQTALFLTSSIALLSNSASADEIAGWMGRWNTLPPRLHEIGITRAHPLHEFSDSEHCPLLDSTEAPENLLRCLDINPPRHQLANRTVLAIAAGAFALAISLYLLGTAVWPPKGRRTLAGVFAALATLLLVPVFCFSWIRRTDGAWKEEPFAWFDGISIWPSLWLRWCALALCAWLLWLAATRIRKVLADISQRFDLPVLTLQKSAHRRFRRWPTQWCLLRRRLKRALLGARPEPAALSARRAWFRFSCGVTPRPLFAAGMLWSVLMMGLIGALSLNYPSLPPVRGDIAIPLFIAIAGTGTLLFLLLVFVSLSVALRLKEMASQLSNHCSNWSAIATSAALDELEAQQFDQELLDEAKLALTTGPSAPRHSCSGKCASGSPLQTILDHYLDILVVEHVSEHNEWLLYFPGVVLSLVIASRWSYLDAWEFDPVAIVMLSLFGAGALLTVWVGNLAATRTRQTALRGLDNVAAKLRANDQKLAQLLRHVQRSIHEVDSGIFRASHWNIVRAMLLPVASAGGLRIVEVLLNTLQ